MRKFTHYTAWIGFALLACTSHETITGTLVLGSLIIGCLIVAIATQTSNKK
jgi:hypothetical protein